MSDKNEPADPEVGEIDEMVSAERQRMRREGAKPVGSRSVLPWIVAAVVLVAVVALVWASFS